MQEHQAFCQQILESIRTPLFLVTPSLHVSFMNKTARELSGRKAAQKKISACNLFCSRKKANGKCREKCRLAEAAAGVFPAAPFIEDLFPGSPASGRYEVTLSPLYDPDKTPAAMLMEITKSASALRSQDGDNHLLKTLQEHEELKKLFAQVKRAKDEWTLTMDRVLDMVVLVDEKGAISRCNKAVCDFSGKSYPEILQQNWLKFFESTGLEVRKPGEAEHPTEVLHAPSNRIFLQTNYITSPDKPDSRTVITFHDITIRKQAQKRLEENRRKLQNALDEISRMIRRVIDNSTSDIYLSLPAGTECCWQALNCKAETCPCYGREPVQCWTIAGSLCRKRNKDSHARENKDCLTCRFYQELADDPIIQIGMQFGHMLQIIQQKNIELQDAFDELKATQSQFLQHEKMASIGQLAAGVAHEINNPIGFITSNLGSLQKYIDRIGEFLKLQAEGYSDDEDFPLVIARKKLKIDYIMEDMPALIAESLDGVERVRKIVQNLKSFSRVDQLDYSLVDVNNCLEDTLNIVWNEVKYKCTVNRQYGEIPPSKCYPQQLNQVFMNLILNAAQAIETQGEITIKTWTENAKIKVAISDTGAGIPPENLKRIFEPFFTTKPVGKGTGLGLSIVYDIITKKHDGTIEVASEPGKGTTFTISLPVRNDDSPQDSPFPSDTESQED